MKMFHHTENHIAHYEWRCPTKIQSSATVAFYF